ncbi:FtsX-like permease family protein [Actinomadura madurae]|uniref:FtsX-like permease family protein n=1 Tax=Actinomadura madurae TaxID=1993 RepID=UPI003D6C491B
MRGRPGCCSAATIPRWRRRWPRERSSCSGRVRPPAGRSPPRSATGPTTRSTRRERSRTSRPSRPRATPTWRRSCRPTSRSGSPSGRTPPSGRRRTASTAPTTASPRPSRRSWRGRWPPSPPYDDLVYVERGFTDSYDKPTLLLGAAAAVLALGASLIATSLAAADARPDVATLAAVGARPRTRRLLTMGQAAFITVLGCWLGLAGGLVPGLAVTRPLTESAGDVGVPAHGAIVDVPWLLLLAIGLGIPLVAACFAGAVTRSRLPMGRRVLS